MSFLDDFVANALNNGATPYVAPVDEDDEGEAGRVRRVRESRMVRRWCWQWGSKIGFVDQKGENKKGL